MPFSDLHYKLILEVDGTILYEFDAIINDVHDWQGYLHQRYTMLRNIGKLRRLPYKIHIQGNFYAIKRIFKLEFIKNDCKTEQIL
jgi:hypothetical protein